MAETAERPLAILHVLRAPVGGLFRHVVDLARGQTARGHRVGILVNSTTGGEHAEAVISVLARELALGVTRQLMSRHLGISDISALRAVRRRVTEVGVDVVHGHGAKGGAYARLTDGGALRAYTPHGGTLNFDPRSAAGILYLGLERVLRGRTDLFLFESAHARDVFNARVGAPTALARVVHNGVTTPEFEPVAPRVDATDLVFVGELRQLKGVDLLIEAIALLAADGRRVTATIVGEGPDSAAFRDLARQRGIADALQFPGVLPAREAFARGRLLVVPSRAESLPYIVLEAAAARVPLLATGVGGIPEIYGPQSGALLPAGDATQLARAIGQAIADPATGRAGVTVLSERVRAGFNVDSMTDGVLAAYRAAIG